MRLHALLCENANRRWASTHFPSASPTRLLGGPPSVDFPGYGDAADPNLNRGSLRAYQGIGSTFFNDLPFADNTLQLSDFVSVVKGRHSLRFGADVRIQQFNVAQLLSPGGWFNFRHDQTSNGPDETGWPIASLITGSTEFAFNSSKTIDPGWRYSTRPSSCRRRQADARLTLRRRPTDSQRARVAEPPVGCRPGRANPAAAGASARRRRQRRGRPPCRERGVAPKTIRRRAARGSQSSTTGLWCAAGTAYTLAILYGQGGVNFITEGRRLQHARRYPNFGQTSNFSALPEPPLDRPDTRSRRKRSTSTRLKAGGRSSELRLHRELPSTFAISAAHRAKGTR